MPKLNNQFSQNSFQYLNHSKSVPGLQKNSNSICSNSRVLNVKFPGVISFLKALPICAIPIGIFFLVVLKTFLKSTNIPCAVSGLKYTVAVLSSVTPWNVLNIKLNLRMLVKFVFPQFGQGILLSSINFTICSSVQPSAIMSCLFSCAHSSISLSALCLVLHSLQSISGSENPDTCPDATHVSGFIRIAASSPTISFFSCINFFLQSALTLFLSSTPKGP